MVLVLLSAERGWFVLLQVCAVGSCSVLLYFGMVLCNVNFVVCVVGRSGCVGKIAARVVACFGLLQSICEKNEVLRDV